MPDKDPTKKPKAATEPKLVKSEKDLPEGGTWETDATGKRKYVVRHKSSAPASNNPPASKPKSVTPKRAISGTPVKPSSTPKKITPPAKEETVEEYVLETPVPEKKTVDPWKQVLGYEGKRTLDPNLTANMPPTYIDGKKALVQGYYIPAERTPEGAWDSSVQMSKGGQKVYAVTNPTTGEVSFLDYQLMGGKEREYNGKKQYSYEPEDFIQFGNNKKQTEENFKHGALRPTSDKAYLESLGVPVDNTKDFIGDVNTGGTGFHTGKLIAKDATVPEIPGKDYKPDPLMEKKKKGGIVGKYASGGVPTGYDPKTMFDVKKYTDQLNKQAGIPNINTPVVEEPSLNAMGGTKIKNMNPNQKAGLSSLISVGTDFAAGAVDAKDRQDGRSSYGGQALTGGIRGAGKGLAIGSNPALMAATGGTSAVIAPIVGAGIGAIAGTVRAGKEKGQMRDLTNEQFAEAAQNSSYDPLNPNKTTKVENYDERDYKTIRGGLSGLFNKSNKFATGGKIVGEGTGTSDQIPATLEKGSFIVPAKNEKVASKIRETMLNKGGLASKYNKGGIPVKVSNGEHLFTPEEVKELTAKGIDLNKLAPEAKTKLREGYNFAKGTKADGGPDWSSMYKKQYAKKPTKTASKKTQAGPVIIENTFPSPNPADDEIIVPEGYKVPTSQYTSEQARADLLNKSALAADAQLAKEAVTPTTNNGSKFDINDALGLGLSGLQAGYGLQQLLKDKRPISKVDPDFDAATNRAQQQAQYGYTPAQVAMLNNQITQGRVSQVAGINAIAGGNAAVGLTNSRAAINSEVANRLKMQSEDERLRMQKEQYANQLVGQRANMRRQIFQDNMNKFMQNQQAGSQLLGAGIQNLVGATRYAQEKQAQDQINKTMYSYLNTVPK